MDRPLLQSQIAFACKLVQHTAPFLASPSHYKNAADGADPFERGHAARSPSAPLLRARLR